MIRFVEVDTRTLDVPKPIARFAGPDVSPRAWWYGGKSWKDEMPAPLIIEVSDSPAFEAPAGLTDFFRTTHIRLVSNRLRKVLEEFGAEVEFWPITLRYRGEVFDGDYWAANALLRLKAVDREKSLIELDEEMGDAISVDRLVLDEAVFIDKHWAIVDEVQRIAVSQEVQDGILASGCTGMRFIEPLEVRY